MWGGDDFFVRMCSNNFVTSVCRYTYVYYAVQYFVYLQIYNLKMIDLMRSCQLGCCTVQCFNQTSSSSRNGGARLLIKIAPSSCAVKKVIALFMIDIEFETSIQVKIATLYLSPGILYLLAMHMQFIGAVNFKVPIAFYAPEPWVNIRRKGDEPINCKNSKLSALSHSDQIFKIYGSQLMGHLSFVITNIKKYTVKTTINDHLVFSTATLKPATFSTSVIGGSLVIFKT